MSVSHQHPDYTAMKEKWDRCEDACSGQTAIHAAGPLYLPMLSEQEPTEYEAYKKRTPFYNATWRTVVGLQGMLFRKPPEVVVPKAVEPMLDDINLAGTPMHILGLEAAEECLKLGRVGLFVDFPNVEFGATMADAKDQNHRPSMKLCKAQSIINWKTRSIKNKTQLSMIVLKEIRDVEIDEFETKDQIQYRVLDLFDQTDTDGVVKTVYRVRVFEVREKNGKSEDVLVDGPFFPMVKGKNLEALPFQFIGVDDVSWTVDEPPLIDLVDMNLSHYRVSADYEHGCHFTGLPTPIVSGYVPDANNEAKFCIGSTTAWVFPRPDAKAFFLEFTGAGLNSLKDNLERKEGYMAILGARMLEVNVKGGVESANTAALHRGGEQSMLSSVSQAISMGIEKVLRIFCDFAGESGEVKYKLNRDFFPIPMDALTLTALIAGWQNGAYSYDTMFAQLKKGEIIAPQKTVEEEQKEIEANPPPVQDEPTTPGNVEVKGPKANETPATPAKTITQQQNGTGNGKGKK